MASRAQDLLMGGGVFGGKSTWAAFETRQLWQEWKATMLVLRLHRAALTGGGKLFEKFRGVYAGEIATGKALIRSSNQVLDLRFPRYQSSITFDGFDQLKRFAKFEGGEYSLIIWDEAQQLSFEKFCLIRQRNRSPDGCKVQPRFLMTCNPPEEGQAGFWLRAFIDWYIDDDGNPIPARTGAIRYYTVQNNEAQWVDADWRDEDGEPPRSFTFIQSLIRDNPVGIAANPGYMSTLRAQTSVEVARKLHGNWDARYGNSLFQNARLRWLHAHELPDGFLAGLDQLRYWDQGAIGEGVEQRPDHCPTASAKGGRALCPVCDGWRWAGFDACWLCNPGAFISKQLAATLGQRPALWLTDILEQFGTPAEIEALHLECAEADGLDVPIVIEIEQGSSGIGNLHNYQTNVLPEYEVIGDRPTGKKQHRAKGPAALAELGLIIALRGQGFEALLRNALRTFTPLGTGAHVDVIDSISGLDKMCNEHEWYVPGVMLT